MRRALLALALLLVVALSLCIPSPGPTSSDVAQAHRRLDDGVWRAVVIGDSVAQGAGDENAIGLAGYLGVELRAKSADPLAPVNLGLNGARTANVAVVLNRLDARAQVAKADLVVISLGGNDLYGDSHARLLTRLLPAIQRRRATIKLAHIVESIERINPAAQVYVLGLYNPYRHSPLAAWLNEQVNLWDGGLIQRLASNQNVTVVRIADLLARGDRMSPLDHFHPGSQGYRAIARRIAETL